MTALQSEEISSGTNEGYIAVDVVPQAESAVDVVPQAESAVAEQKKSVIMQATIGQGGEAFGFEGTELAILDLGPDRHQCCKLSSSKTSAYLVGSRSKQQCVPRLRSSVHTSAVRRHGA